jgi:protease II
MSNYKSIVSRLSPLGWPKQLTPNSWSEEGYTIYYYHVHSSGDYILVGAMKYGSEKHDIFKFDRNGNFTPLLVDSDTEYANVVFKNRDEFFLIAASDTNRTLCKYTISTGILDSLYSEDEWIDIYDYHDGLILCERWFSFSESQIFIIDEQTHKAVDKSPKGQYDYSFFADDNKILTITNKLSKENEFSKLVIFNIDKPEKLRVLYDPKMEIDGFEFIKPISTGIFVLNNNGYSQIKAIDIFGNELNLPKTDIGVISDCGVNNKGDIAFGFSSPSKSPTIFKTRLGAKKLITTATVSSFGFDFSDVKVKTIKYPSKDGVMIPSLIYLPAGIKTDGTNPAIIDYHGGPPGQSRPYFQRNIALALSKGFIMMFPNVRGSTGYGPAWEAADNLEGRYNALDDCIAALDYLVDAGYSNPEKIGIWGTSYGGYVVNYLAVAAPEKFACAISNVGEADMDYSNSHGDLTFLAGWEREYGPIGSKLTHDLSPIFKAENISKPMLITAGFNDPRVFAGGPRRWSSLLASLNKDILYFEEISTGHWGTSKQQVIDSYTRAYTYFIKHLMK